MKKLIFALLVFLSASNVYSQTRYNAGIGYQYEGENPHGMVLELEYEKFFANNFSLPLRADLGFFVGADYNNMTVEIQKGFRKYFPSSFFIEQMFGIGAMATSYKTDIWYIDKYDNSIAHGNKAIINLMPSVSFGAGYRFSSDEKRNNFIWIRPKAYWKIGFRGLHLPYLAIQAGFTHTFKTK